MNNTKITVCEHEDTEHYPADDVHPGSQPYTVCLKCGDEVSWMFEEEEEND